VKGLFDTRSDLAAFVRGLPPEHRERLTFHLPLEVQALEVAGADRDLITDRVERRLPAAFAASLVDPPMFRWAERHYGALGEGLLARGADDRRHAFEQILALGPGLAGGAFHPLIRFGYGALRRDAHEITRGLAYLRVRRQVLFARPVRGADPTELGMPTPEELDGSSVFDQLDLVAGERALLGDGPEPPLPSVAELAATATGLVLRDPGSFIAVHTVTGLHGLVEVDRLVTGRDDLGEVPSDPLLCSWWRAMADAITACAVIVSQADASSAGPGEPPVDLDVLVEQAIGSSEVHDLKISVSLRRLAALGVVPPDRALEVGAAKLAATAALGADRPNEQEKGSPSR
jgi:hypothetical protein